MDNDFKKHTAGETCIINIYLNRKVRQNISTELYIRIQEWIATDTIRYLY